MECSCVRQTDIPGTSKLLADLIYHFDRVRDFIRIAPVTMLTSLDAARLNLTFPDDRRAALVRALTPLNQGNPSLDVLAQPGHGGGRHRPAGGFVLRARLHSL